MLVICDTVAHFTMTSASGSSRLLVFCCCVSIASVLLYCVGYVRLELELRAYKERLETLEQREKELATTRIPKIPTNGESGFFFDFNTELNLFLLNLRKLWRSLYAFHRFKKAKPNAFKICSISTVAILAILQTSSVCCEYMRNR